MTETTFTILAVGLHPTDQGPQEYAVVCQGGQSARVNVALLRLAAEQQDSSLARSYRKILLAVEEYKESVRVRDVRKCPAHKPSGEPTVGAWTAPVAVTEVSRNPAADGGVVYGETCRCGARRLRVVNGSNVETSPWS